jgi:ElaB/YqjD/DUF883 family membrane-anchored ribosome-binding protein
VAAPAARWVSSHVVQPAYAQVKSVGSRAFAAVRSFAAETKAFAQQAKVRAQEWTKQLSAKVNKFVCTTAARIKSVDWKKVGKVALNVGMIAGGVLATATGVGAPLGVALVAAGVGDLAFTAADTQEELTGSNFIKDNLFRGNEMAYLGVELAVGLVAPGPGGEVRAGVKLTEKAVQHSDEIVDAAKGVVNGIVKNGDDAAKGTGKTIADGVKMKTNDALDAADDFLGKGYKDMGNGRFVSADGTKQVRMGDSDITGQHGGRPHMNFETLVPNPRKPGKMMPDPAQNLHIFLDE